MRKGNVQWLVMALGVMLWSVSQIVVAASPPTPKYFGEKWGLINTAGKLVVEPKFERLGSVSEGLAAVRINQREGFVDKTGKVVIEARFAAVGDFSGGLARANLGGLVTEAGELRGGKWGFLNRSGTMVIAPMYEEAGDFAGGLAPVKAIGRWGYIDGKGKVTIGFLFDYARNFSDGLAFVIVKGKAGYIDAKMGGPLNPWDNHLRYEQYGDFQEGLAPALAKERWGFINKQGNLVIPCQFYEVKGFSEGLAPFRVGTRWGYLSQSGQVVIRPQFAEAGLFNGGLAYVELEDRSKGYIDPSGEFVFKSSFAGLYDFSEGLARVHTRTGWGYVDKANKLVIDPVFDLAGPFSEGMAYVAAGERFGYINVTGSWTVQPGFAGASEFKSGLALVATEKWKEVSLQWIDPKGKVLKTFADILREGSPLRSHLLSDLSAVTISAGLKMRKQPDPKSEQVGIIPYGKKIKVLQRTRTSFSSDGISGNWVLAEYNQVKGYIFDGYLSRLPAPEREYANDLGEYLDPYFGERKMKTVYYSAREVMNITFGSSGMVVLLAGEAETDNASLIHWIPGVSMREVFLLLQNLVYKDFMVTHVNDKSLPAPLPLAKLPFPGEQNRIKLEFYSEGWNFVIILEKEGYGYIRVVEI